MQLRMEMDMRENDFSMEQERSFQSKEKKQEMQKLLLNEKKNQDEIQWLKT